MGEPDVSNPRWIRSGAFVYFVRAGQNGLVKIGTTVRPDQRLRNLAHMSGVPLRILRLIRGNHELENSIHRYFEKDRQHGEWFALSERLAKWLASLPDARFLETYDTQHAYRLCTGCGWQGDHARMYHRCRGCNRETLERRQCFVCTICGAQVADTETHLRDCGTIEALEEAGAIARPVEDRVAVSDWPPAWLIEVARSVDYQTLPLVLLPEELKALAGPHAAEVDELVRNGRIPCLRWGRQIRIPKSFLARLLPPEGAANAGAAAILKLLQSAEGARETG